MSAKGAPRPLEFKALRQAIATISHRAELAHGTKSTVQWWGTWNYPLHVGAVLGIPSKVLSFIAALGIATLPVTGLWMWWQRRPLGETSFPRRPDTRIPSWLKALVLLACCLLPLAGLSVLVILAGERLQQYASTRRRLPAES